MTERPHLGRNLSRIRTAREMKQETLAKALGISQQAVSRMEQKAVIKEESLTKIAEILDVPLAAIKAYDQKFIISNIITDHKHRYTFLQKTIRWIKRLLGLRNDK
ncbi:Helix-turn-helix [Pedobacter steynii]|uniref:Helix-turn-helix n=1 Tax=Pedobacter steynii TaxID=430522 RepID=A0A1G9YKI6_9SPHI|nr:helix-turn-helix transcriptional regulator [Pedobacter steynii]NQX39757.1 helix-turn-helix transcriptional regulator [Pedobacter steynii]SDN09668.1 Helix-turn-helix [Pedobacter steynii]